MTKEGANPFPPLPDGTGSMGHTWTTLCRQIKRCDREEHTVPWQPSLDLTMGDSGQDLQYPQASVFSHMCWVTWYLTLRLFGGLHNRKCAVRTGGRPIDLYSHSGAPHLLLAFLIDLPLYTHTHTHTSTHTHTHVHGQMCTHSHP